jgi:hypothetical protein
MNLQNIPVTIFEKLLDFIYNEAAPEDDVELTGIYAAAGELNIVDLKNITADKLMNTIDDKNAMKILKLSNKYGNEELRIKAFEKIKKILSEYKMSIEFSKNPEKIEKLLDIKRTLDMEFQKLQQEMQAASVDEGSKDVLNQVQREAETSNAVVEGEQVRSGSAEDGSNSDEYEVVG